MKYGKAPNRGLHVFNYNRKEKTLTVILLLLVLVILTSISYIFKFGCKSTLLFLPLFFGIFITYKSYPNYKKTLKSVVDFILYFSSSITAIAYIIIHEKIFDVLGKSFEINSIMIFLLLYFIAIITVIKCCVSYCDAVEAYRDETNIHISKNERNRVHIPSDEKARIDTKAGLMVFLLYLLLK